MLLDLVPLQASTEDAGQIGKQLALVAAVAAAMQLFLAPTLHAQIEALQASKLVPKRFGGVAAIVLGALYGLIVGILGVTQTDEGWPLLLVGVLGGIVAGGGAVIADQRLDGLVAGKVAGAAAGTAGANEIAPVAGSSVQPGASSADESVETENGLVSDESVDPPSSNGAGTLAASRSGSAGPH